MTTLNFEAILNTIANKAIVNQFEQTGIYIGNNRSVIEYEGTNFLNFIVESRAFKEDFIAFIGKPMWMMDFRNKISTNEFLDDGKPGEDNFGWWVQMYHNSLEERTPEQWYALCVEHTRQASKRMFG